MRATSSDRPELRLRLYHGLETLTSRLGALAGAGVLLLVAVTLGQLLGRLLLDRASPRTGGVQTQLALAVVCLSWGAAQFRSRARRPGSRLLSRLDALLGSSLLALFYLSLAIGSGAAVAVAWVTNEPGPLLPGWAARALLSASFLLLAAVGLGRAMAPCRPHRPTPAEAREPSRRC